MTRHLVGLLMLLDVSQVQAGGLVAKFTPPDATLTHCQVAIQTSVVANDVVPYACPADPANDCVDIPLTLAAGHYPFQLVCAAGEVMRSNVLRVFIP